MRISVGRDHEANSTFVDRAVQSPLQSRGIIANRDILAHCDGNPSRGGGSTLNSTRAANAGDVLRRRAFVRGDLQERARSGY